MRPLQRLAMVWPTWKLSAAWHALMKEDTGEDARRAREVAELRQTMAECDRKLKQHRAMLEAGADPVEVTQWMNETKAERSAAEAKVHRLERTPKKAGKDDVMKMVNDLGDIARVLGEAEPWDKVELYQGLGLRMRYDPVKNSVRAEIRLDPHQKSNDPRGGMVRVRGGT